MPFFGGTFGPNIFRGLNVFGPKTFLNWFFLTKMLVDQMFLHLNFFCILGFFNQIFCVLKFFWTQNGSDPKEFLDSKFFEPNFFLNQDFFYPKIFGLLDPKSFWTQYFFWLKMFLNKKCFWIKTFLTKYFYGPKTF